MNQTKISIEIFKYVITFIDKSYEIHDNLENTIYCNSILERIDDIYLKKDNNIYMCNALKNTFTIINCNREENQNEIKEQKWVKKIIKDYYQNEFFFTNESKKTQKFIHKIQNEYSEIFFIQQIHLLMNQFLFQKILQLPFTDNIEFTCEDIFYIIYSYAFSMLDNYIYILEKMVLMISLNLLKISELNLQFIYFVDKNYGIKITQTDVDFFQQENSTQNIEKKIKPKSTERDRNISEKLLGKWKQSLFNVFKTLQRFSAIEIIIPDHFSTLQIQNEKNISFTVKIPHFNLENVLILITKEFFFVIRNINAEVRNFILSIAKKTMCNTIRIDLTEYFTSLYGLSEQKIQSKHKICHKYLELLNKRTRKNIIFIVGCFAKTRNRKNIEVCSFQYDEKEVCHLFLISKFLLNMKGISTNYLLIKFASKIIIFFNEIKNFRTQNINIHENIMNRINIDSYFEYGSPKLKYYGYDGKISPNNYFLSTKNASLRIKNCLSLSGFYDGNYSFFQIINNCADKNRNIVAESIFSKTIQNKSNLQDFIFINEIQITIQIYGSKSENSVCFTRIKREHDNLDFDINELNQIAHDDRITEFLSLPDSKNPNLTFLLFHSTKKNIQEKCIVKKYQSFLTKTSFYPLILPKLRIQKSNFHFIFMRVMEIESFEEKDSFFEFKSRANSYNIQIKNCKITFLKQIPRYIKKLHIENSSILSILELFSHQLYFVNAEIVFSQFTIILDGSIMIKSLNSEFSKFKFFLLDKELKFVCNNCSINLYSSICFNAYYIQFTDCKIKSENDTLIIENFKSNTKITKNENYSRISSRLSALVIKETVCPKNIRIISKFNSISIFSIHSAIEIQYKPKNMHISYSMGFLSVANEIFDAKIRTYSSIIYKTENIYILEELDIQKLQCININELRIKSCSIIKIEDVFTENIYVQSIASYLKIIYANEIIILDPSISESYHRNNAKCSLITKNSIIL